MNGVNGRFADLDNVSTGEARMQEKGVLVIEDCEPLLFYLNSALLTLGYHQQHLAANLAEAEAVWVQHQDEIRTILLNYELPDGVGFEFASRALRDRPEVNIVITTGYDLASVREASGDAKKLQFLQKPFRLGELKTALETPAPPCTVCS